MPAYCVVKKCHQFGGHKFPKDEKYRQEWIDAIKREGFTPTPASTICKKHFTPESFKKREMDLGKEFDRKRLCKEAIPTIFPWTHPHLFGAAKTKRKGYNVNIQPQPPPQPVQFNNNAGPIFIVQTLPSGQQTIQQANQYLNNQPINIQPVPQSVNIQPNQSLNIRPNQPISIRPINQSVNIRPANQPVNIQPIQPIRFQPANRKVNVGSANQLIKLLPNRPVNIRAPLVNQPVVTLSKPSEVQSKPTQASSSNPKVSVTKSSESSLKTRSTRQSRAARQSEASIITSVQVKDTPTKGKSCKDISESPSEKWAADSLEILSENEDLNTRNGGYSTSCSIYNLVTGVSAKSPTPVLLSKVTTSSCHQLGNQVIMSSSNVNTSNTTTFQTGNQVILSSASNITTNMNTQSTPQKLMSTIMSSTQQGGNVFFSSSSNVNTITNTQPMSTPGTSGMTAIMSPQEAGNVIFSSSSNVSTTNNHNTQSTSSPQKGGMYTVTSSTLQGPSIFFSSSSMNTSVTQTTAKSSTCNSMSQPMVVSVPPGMIVSMAPSGMVSQEQNPGLPRLLPKGPLPAKYLPHRCRTSSGPVKLMPKGSEPAIIRPKGEKFSYFTHPTQAASPVAKLPISQNKQSSQTMIRKEKVNMGSFLTAPSCSSSGSFGVNAIETDPDSKSTSLPVLEMVTTPSFADAKSTKASRSGITKEVPGDTKEMEEEEADSDMDSDEDGEEDDSSKSPTNSGNSLAIDGEKDNTTTHSTNDISIETANSSNSLAIETASVMQKTTYFRNGTTQVSDVIVVRATQPPALSKEELKQLCLKAMLTCYVCKQTFNDKGCLDHHCLVYNQGRTKVSKCCVCDTVFDDRASFVKHSMVHTGSKPCDCPICGEGFTRVYMLKAHLITVHGSNRPKVSAKKTKDTSKLSRPSPCEICGKVFIHKQHLGRHMRTHWAIDNQTVKNEKEFQCTYCGMMFKQNHKLQRHMRVHTGEKPYQCSICSRSFARKFYLTVHQRTHTGEKPYQCSYCGKRFAQSNNLIGHEKTHHRAMLNYDK